MKVALISHTLPPSGTGQALVLYRLFQHVSPDSYCLISTDAPDHGSPRNRYSEKLPARYFRLPRPRFLKRGYRFGLARVRQHVNMLLAVFQHARNIAVIVNQESCGAVLACTGDVTLLPAGYLASRWRRLPFYAFIIDHYSYREWGDSIAPFWARLFEPWLIRGADVVICGNEIIRDDLNKHYGIDATVIHNSFDISPYESEWQRPSANGEVKIVFTGEIYDAHYDAFRNLVTAIESLKRSNIKLHLYTNRSREDLKRLGIEGRPIVCHEPRNQTEMPGIQRQADLLFLPLAFDSPYPNLVRTSSTTKLGEYLAARRPVLVHAPTDSFVSWYNRQHKCGVVVDESNPAKLAESIELILNDPDLRQSLSDNAWQRACIDFDLSNARSTFAKLVNL